MLTELFVPACAQTLRAMLYWLDKAAAHAEGRSEPADALLALRLAPDMYPLAAQLRLPAYLSLEAVWRLGGHEPPAEVAAIRQQSWAAGERPGTWAEVQAILATAAAELDRIAPSSLDHEAERAIAFDLPDGTGFAMTGMQFVRDWTLPQIHFHASIAYAILRHHGVTLGKADLLGHMFRYVQRGVG